MVRLPMRDPRPALPQRGSAGQESPRSRGCSRATETRPHGV